MTVRITRWEPVAGGFLLAFVATRKADFQGAVAAVKTLPYWQRQWQPDAGCWWVDAEGVSALVRMLPALAAHLESQRGEEARRKEQHEQESRKRAHKTRRRRTSSAPAVPPDVADALVLLCLTPSAPAELVAAARRVHARLHHPDHGGDHGRMVATNNAADCVEAWLAARSATARRETA